MRPFVILLITLFLRFEAEGQQDKLYLSFEFLNISSTEEASFLKLNEELDPMFKNAKSQGIIQNRALLKLWYPGRDPSGFNYVVITAYNQYNKLEKTTVELLDELQNSENKELIEGYKSLYQLTKREITEVWRNFLEARKFEDKNFIEHLSGGQYLHIQYLDVMDDKWDEYVNLEEKIWTPIHKANIKKDRLVYWSLFGYWFEQRSIDYDLFSIFVYPEFEGLKDKFYNQDTWREVHDKETADKIFSDTFAFRKDIHAEAWKVVYVLD